MARLDSAIRQKRFKVLPECEVVLKIETSMGTRIDLRIADASVHGLAATVVTETEAVPEGLNPGEIIPESKIIWRDQNATLGRLVVKRAQAEDGQFRIAFTCIDGKVPLFGTLSRCFVELSKGIESPLEFELDAKRFNVANFVETEFEHPDLFEKCRQYQYLHDSLKKNPLYQYYSVKQSTDKARVRYKLSRSSRKVECVSFASYDYLGFTKHPEVIEAAKLAIEKFGMSAQGTMILAGETSIHEELEAKVSTFFDREDTLLYTTGYATNVGLVTGIVRPNDLIIADIYSHASLHDGIAASKAKARFFKHNSMKNMSNLLEEHRNSHRGCLLITEGLYSMEGTTPDVKEFVSLAKKYNARTFIDECHSIGVLGPNGKGAAERDDVLDDIDIYMGSFSKGLGAGGGGFITGKKEVINWLRFFSRPGMFSAALPPAVAAAALKVMELIERMPENREKLQNNIRRFQKGLRKMGIQTECDPESPIIPVVVGDQEVLGQLNEIMVNEGVFVNCILFPAVPIDSARFRFSITSLHSDSDIDLALSALQKAFEKIEVPQMKHQLKKVG